MGYQKKRGICFGRQQIVSLLQPSVIFYCFNLIGLNSLEWSTGATKRVSVKHSAIAIFFHNTLRFFRLVEGNSIRGPGVEEYCLARFSVPVDKNYCTTFFIKSLGCVTCTTVSRRSDCEINKDGY
ncbi:unnamed protein product [Albugo candida]|uniref:Uncharacterized protein n=1 Tax=Albugo candida TaxID=65357 RepID=A0A024GB87_9STRA|nr:unnamed protein product [Albugo candida]|eukprot:CCI43899.1 unnamed protein product [Albugo candida]